MTNGEATGTMQRRGWEEARRTDRASGGRESVESGKRRGRSGGKREGSMPVVTMAGRENDGGG